uniref:Uncharacterized protein n=1 Tax=Sphaeramia orbicularis TaxID=375764 RepID=A0A672ZKU2_9TELE
WRRRTQKESDSTAAAPLLHGDPVVLAPLPGKPSALGGPCAYLSPAQPPSLPSCGGDVLTLRDADDTPCGTPQAALPCPAHMPPHAHLHPQPLGPSPTALYDPVRQDALHEDSVRGLVKLSSV